jgi:hypothetical protein
VDLVSLAAELLDGIEVVPTRDEPLGQLGDPSQLIAHALEVLLPQAGGESEVVVLAHGLQDTASFFN